MNTAVITYSNAQNYGAQLQAFALTQSITKMGHKCELIDYRPFDDRWFKPRKTIGDICMSLLLCRQGKVRVRRFQKFRKDFLKLTKNCSTDNELKNLNEQFNVFISGSDQVWNCSGRVNEAFFLRFVESCHVRAAYAPSFGAESVPKFEENKVAKFISDFDIVSVRETSGKKLVYNLTGKDVPVVMDPVFLLTKNEWRDLINPIDENNTIFIYTTQVNDEIEKLAQEAHRKFGAQVISTQFISNCGCKVKKNIGPLEFLQYIASSRYVISTSFHATAFSIILQKDFCVLPHSHTGARVIDLLELVGLERLIVKNADLFNFPTLENWDTIENKLSQLIIESNAYLKKIFEVANEKI